MDYLTSQTVGNGDADVMVETLALVEDGTRELEVDVVTVLNPGGKT